MISVSDLKEDIFNTKTCALKLSDSGNEFEISMPHDNIKLNLCSLIVFKRKLEQVNIIEILSDAEVPDVEIISMLNCDRMIVLDVKLVLELKELLAGAFTMMELNSIIHRQLLRTDVFGV